VHRQGGDEVVIVEDKNERKGHKDQVVDQGREQRFRRTRRGTLLHGCYVPTDGWIDPLQRSYKVGEKACRVAVACIRGKPSNPGTTDVLRSAGGARRERDCATGDPFGDQRGLALTRRGADKREFPGEYLIQSLGEAWA
jgi:hypothetical protein